MTTPGPRQHYLPASFVARFSSDTDPDVRRRHVFAARRNGDGPYALAAENAAFVRNLYSEAVDAIWTDYEARLPAALDALCDPTHELDAEVWLRVLVPFVAA